MLEQPLDFTGCSSIQFFSLLLSLTQLVRLPGVTYHLLCSTCMTYGKLCHAIGHQVLPTQPLPKEAEDFPRGNKYPKYAYTVRLLATGLINNSELLFKYVKIMNVLLVVKSLDHTFVC